MKWSTFLLLFSFASNASADTSCEVYEVDVQFADHTGASSFHCIPDAEDEGGIAGIAYELKGLDAAFVAANEGKLRSGQYKIKVPGGVRDRGNAEIKVPPGAQVSLEKKADQKSPRQLLRGGDGAEPRVLAPKTIGTSSVLVLRVVANDASTTASVSTLSDRVFGTSGDSVNLKSQFDACSFGRLTFNPATGSGITNGVGVVNVNINAAGNSNTNVMNAVTTAATNAFGNLENNFDHVMYCLPPGTSGSWIGYGYFNYFLTVYNDDWCNYVSIQMHELGHNMNLQHAGQGSDQYGDQSGMMGYSYGSSDTPVMCFNAAKSWQLGWYADRHQTANPTSAAAGALLASKNDFDETDASHTVVLKVEAGTTDLFLTYHKQEGINSGTEEFGNQVTVVSQAGTGESSMLAALNNGGTYTVSNFASSGSNLVIEVCDIVAGTPDYAEVSVYLNNGAFGSTCGSLGAVPTTSPVFAPTPSPTVPPPTPMPTIPPPTNNPVIAPTRAPTVAVCDSIDTWADSQCVSNCDGNRCHKQCASKCSSVCGCNGGGPGPVPSPVASPVNSPVVSPPTATPPTGSCSGNKAQCTSPGQCCSGNCKGGTCKGG